MTKERIPDKDDTITAEEAIKDERCAVPRELFQDVATLASASKLTQCEVQTEAIRQ